MSAQTRYRTLVANTGAIYSAGQDVRTTLLQKGLDEIVGAIQPLDATQWSLVKTDSERLLKVWYSKEQANDPAAQEVVTQLLDLLRELSSVAPPTLVVTDRIAHIHDYVQDSDEEEPVRLTVVPVVPVVPAKVVPTEEEIVEDGMEVDEEEEEEAEEEDGMEVEQVTIRGRTYWLETNTKKLYANDNDEVGDEVGAMVNGKPLFLSK